MKRSVNLLVCLGIFVMGIVLAQANDGKDTAATATKPCCGDEKKGETPPAGKPAAPAEAFGPPYACLQYLLYEDDMIALWAADEYPALPCTAVPDEIYLWTAAGIAAPQTCEFGCENLSLRPLAAQNPVLSAKLAVGARYNDKPSLHPVPLPQFPGTKWKHNDGITLLGEMQYDYVAVVNDLGVRVPIKLSAGVAEFDRVAFPMIPPPPKVRRRTIAITIGFETVLPNNVVLADLPLLNAYKWRQHSTSKTAFTVEWEGSKNNKTIYYVTTKTPVTVNNRPTATKSDK